MGGHKWQFFDEGSSAGRGGSLMIWGGIFLRGTTKLVVWTNKLDAFEYFGVLYDALLPFLDAKYGEKNDTPVFQHDNAPSHTAIFTNKCLEEGISLLD